MALKRGGFLPRRTPLTNKTPIARKSRLGRAPFVAKAPKVTREERAARKLVAYRSQGVCERCGRVPATNMHHRLLRSRGGRWSPENLMHLCGSGSTGCHGDVTVNVKVATEQGWVVPSHRDPADVPVWLARVGFVFLNADGSITEIEEEEVA